MNFQQERRRFIRILGSGLLIPVVPVVFDFGGLIKSTGSPTEITISEVTLEALRMLHKYPPPDEWLKNNAA